MRKKKIIIAVSALLTLCIVVGVSLLVIFRQKEAVLREVVYRHVFTNDPSEAIPEENLNKIQFLYYLGEYNGMYAVELAPLPDGRLVRRKDWEQDHHIVYRLEFFPHETYQIVLVSETDMLGFEAAFVKQLISEEDIRTIYERWVKAKLKDGEKMPSEVVKQVYYDQVLAKDASKAYSIEDVVIYDIYYEQYPCLIAVMGTKDTVPTIDDVWLLDGLKSPPGDLYPIDDMNAIAYTALYQVIQEAMAYYESFDFSSLVPQ